MNNNNYKSSNGDSCVSNHYDGTSGMSVGSFQSEDSTFDEYSDDNEFNDDFDNISNLTVEKNGPSDGKNTLDLFCDISQTKCIDAKEVSHVHRPSWNEYFCEIVTATAKRSPCKRLHVGCLLTKNNRIISQGYNGFLPGCPHNSIIRDGHEQATIHAEQNALCDCAKRGVPTIGCTAYITHFPCLICARLLLAAGISKIYYMNDYKNDDLVHLFCLQKNVIVEKLEYW